MELVDRAKEELVVARAQLGDEQAFEHLVRKYLPRLRYYISKLLKCPDMADDVLQDVWATILQEASQAEGSKGIFRMDLSDRVYGSNQDASN